MVAALALAGAACGGDDDGDVTDDASTTSDEPDAAEDGDEAEDADDGDDGDAGGEWCELARELDSSTLFEDIDITDPESIESAYNEAIAVMDDAVDAAPDEIKADVELVFENSKTLVAELEEVDFDFTKVDQTIFENAEVDAAGVRLDEYGERVCGIESASDDPIDDGSGATDDSVDAGGDLSGDSAVRDELLRQLVAAGMTDEQANCMADNLDMEEVAANGADDPSMFFDLLETCDIDPTQLQSGG